MAPEFCPHCGAEVPARARVCPSCGSDESTGWSDQANAQRLDLPDSEFDYEGFVARELEGKHNGRSLFWCLVAIGLIVVLLLVFLL
jgi:uncharacterized membrane protein YvbJ